MGFSTNSIALGSALHVIQVAITPIFMLASIAALLNVFTTRFGRVADQADALNKSITSADETAARLLSRRLERLWLRSLVLEVAVILGAVSGAATCATVLALFIGETLGVSLGIVLFCTFGLAVACVLAAIVLFAVEMMIANRHVRDVVAA